MHHLHPGTAITVTNTIVFLAAIPLCRNNNIVFDAIVFSASNLIRQTSLSPPSIYQVFGERTAGEEVQGGVNDVILHAEDDETVGCCGNNIEPVEETPEFIIDEVYNIEPLEEKETTEYATNQESRLQQRKPWTKNERAMIEEPQSSKQSMYLCKSKRND
ncbi:uncharacterized protein [Rutidosis leptorrhynchoides]|uniref:uncharacterized protein isoform X1 n=1 Tax=Rutidosis leptorrhynchoides TaxID=125765 RepID=UPI003A98FABD